MRHNRPMTLPATAAWRHLGARTGFEVAHLRERGSGCRIVGSTSAVDGQVGWTVGYEIDLDEHWRTRRARVTSTTASGTRSVLLECDGAGHWKVDGAAESGIDGCLDVDLESSSLTNAFPVHRLSMRVGDSASAPAAYVRAENLVVERLDQTYARIEDGDQGPRYDYAAPVFDVECVLAYARDGLVVDYPGIATRAR